MGKRSSARRHDLFEALKDVLEGNPVRVAKTEAVGCPVEIRRPTPDANSKVEYYRDIQPFLYSHCVVCHQDKSVAPFSLATYEDHRPVGVFLIFGLMMSWADKPIVRVMSRAS